MNAKEEPRRTTIEPLDPDKHDRVAFSCGVEQVDNYFKNTANKLAKAGNVSVRVMVDNDNGRVIGFYSTNAHAIDYQDLPRKYARTRPGHGTIPAAYISMMGVHEDCSGQGYGGILLADAMKRIARAADQLGVAVILLDVLDCGDPEQLARRKAFYEGFKFQPLPSQPLRLFMPVATVKQLMDA